MSDYMREEARVSLHPLLIEHLNKIKDWKHKNIKQLLIEYGNCQKCEVQFKGEVSKYMTPGVSFWQSYARIATYKGNDIAATNLQLSIAFVSWVFGLYENLPEFCAHDNDIAPCFPTKIDENDFCVKEAKKLLAFLSFNSSEQ